MKINGIYEMFLNAGTEKQVLMVCIMGMMFLVVEFVCSGKWKDNILLTVSFVILTTCQTLVLADLKIYAIVLSTLSSMVLAIASDSVRNFIRAKDKKLIQKK